MRRRWVFAAMFLLTAPTGRVSAWARSSASNQRESREGYQRNTRNKLDEWSSRIETLQARSEHAGAEIRWQLQKSIRQLKEQLQPAQRHLEELEASAETQWEKLRPSLDRSLANLQHSYERAISRFKTN